MEKLRKVLVLVMVMVLGFSAVALCDWDQEDGHKMHYPQTPDPDGWDVCVCCQWIADDFTCSRTGPIDDIHFWISWRSDDVGEMTDEDWEIAIYEDASGAPGNRLWSLQNATFVIRGPFQGEQGWVCPSPDPPLINYNDHKQYYQVNITEIEEPFIQQAKTTYWLVIRANINPEQMAVGWKTAETDDYQKPALWTQTPSSTTKWVPVRDTVDEIYDMAFVITGREEEPKHDFGDAPDDTPTGAGGYPTLLANNGAYHVIGGPWLGDDNDMPDDEPDGQPDAAATGDDNDGNDDEDGVQLFDLTPNVNNLITVEVNGGGGYLSIWVDWNGDMDWDDVGERAYTSPSPLGDGDHYIPLVPPVTSVEQTFLRARISSLLDIGYDGGAPDGEVEDHKVYIEKVLDFGDAPDNTPVGGGYPTLLANNGAYHIIGGPWFGDDNDAPDVEADGQPTSDADGDDNDGNDDEDGIQIPVLIQGEINSIIIEVNGGGGYISMWLDWNGDMDWDDPGEAISFAGFLGDGMYNISIIPQSTWIIGKTFLRARINSSMFLPPTGGADDGEIEDYEVYIEEAPEFDYGDAPDSAAAMQYPTLFASDGARHLVVPGIMLGNQIDAEADGQPTSDADGDDLNNLDDEDGVQFTTPLVPGMYAEIDVTASIAGNLNVWIDYNGDYSWAEAGDHVFTDHPIGMGTTTLGFMVPGTATPGIETFARFRFTSPNITGIDYKGYTRDGEVEDYKVKIDKPIIKWSQPPMFKDEDDECFWGWNEESVYGVYEEREMQIVADDWLCMDYRPITDIHWWGSYLNWREDIPPDYAPARFHIGIWTDVPAGTDVPFSHPGKMIWEWIVPRAYLWERPVGCDYHEDYPDMIDMCFRYDLQLPEDVWFWQEKPETIYWISISAIYSDIPPEQNIWGWKTREHYFNDDAVRIFRPTAPVPGDTFTSGEPIYDNAGTSWDMAFELTTQECLTPDTAVFPPLHPRAGVNYYSEWVNVGYPKCWCYARQCWGDAAGDRTGTLFTGYTWVGLTDLDIFALAWNVLEPDKGPGIDSVPNGICADFNHDLTGTLFTGYTRVGLTDLTIFAATWNVLEPDKGPGIPGDCGGTLSP